LRPCRLAEWLPFETISTFVAENSHEAMKTMTKA